MDTTPKKQTTHERRDRLGTYAPVTSRKRKNREWPDQKKYQRVNKRRKREVK